MDDRHLEALQGIWGEMKTMNGRINTIARGQDETNARLDQTIGRLDQTNSRLDRLNARLEGVEGGVAVLGVRLERLERVQVESETRLATELVAVVGAIHEVRDLMRESRSDRKRLEKLERRVDALEKKTG
jgi:chromosome segregation ATPase